MIIRRKVTSKRKCRKELSSIAKLSGSIGFVDKLLRDKQKKWCDVSPELYGVLHVLNAKLKYYKSLRPSMFSEKLIPFVEDEIRCCENVIQNYKVSSSCKPSPSHSHTPSAPPTLR